MKINIYPSATKASYALIEHINDILSGEPDRIFNIAFSGGETPAMMYDLWANEYIDNTPWHRIRFWWVDERCGRPGNSDCNYALMKSTLLDTAPIPRENIFRIHGETAPEEEVVRYSNMVKKLLPTKDCIPFFDLILLGVGTDGHTASIFPGEENLLSSNSIYTISQNPYNGQMHITMTGLPIINAHEVIFFVTGKAKADVIKQMVSSGDESVSSFIAHHASHVELFLDNQAASLIE